MVLQDGLSLSSQLRPQQEVILASNCPPMGCLGQRSHSHDGENTSAGQRAQLGRRDTELGHLSLSASLPICSGLTLCREHWKDIYTGRELLWAR